jgi:hypothetical protein
MWCGRDYLAREAEKRSQDGEDCGTICLVVRRVDATEFPMGPVATGYRGLDDSGHGFDLNDELSSKSLISGGGEYI